MKYAVPEDFDSIIRLKLAELHWEHRVDIGIDGNTVVLKTHRYVMNAERFAKLVAWFGGHYGLYFRGSTESGWVFTNDK